MKMNLSRTVLVLLLALLLPAAACSKLGLGTIEPEPAPLTGQYLDFKDVQIPSELSLDKDASFIYETNNIKAGVLGLTGDMPLVEALKYFEEHMAQDGWVSLSSFKYHKNILIYTKPEKVCLIIASWPKGAANLQLEVWVSPTQSGYAAGLGSSGKAKSGPKEEDIPDPNDGS
ncbi:MAG: hypothetical protein AB1896_02210 [Thermodesulfobacteriota bacterium]